MPSLTHREQAGLDSSHLSLLDLHTAQPVRDLVMFMRAAECVDESIMTRLVVSALRSGDFKVRDSRGWRREIEPLSSRDSLA
jgi:hypothetical protein